ncbi:MAG: hypothetical protein N4A40_12800 [Tissierellales bacterium]|jgi:hypothetical protein|nr:hypothetical protein [Tissierellales bacterium]
MRSSNQLSIEMGLAVVIIIVSILYHFFDYQSSSNTVIFEEDIEIESINKDTQLEGSMLGSILSISGEVEEEEEYVVMLKTLKEGCSKAVKFSEDDVNYYEYDENTNTPHIRITWKKRIDDSKIFMNTIDERYREFTETNGIVMRIDIYVPKGSSEKGFSNNSES